MFNGCRGASCAICPRRGFEVASPAPRCADPVAGRLAQAKMRCQRSCLRGSGTRIHSDQLVQADENGSLGGRRAERLSRWAASPRCATVRESRKVAHMLHCGQTLIFPALLSLPSGNLMIMMYLLPGCSSRPVFARPPG